MSIPKHLTAKQRKFVEMYMLHLDAPRAYGEAFGKIHNRPACDVGARRMFKTANVMQYMADEMVRRSARTMITQDRVLQEVARIAFANVTNLFEWDETEAKFVPSRDLTEDQSAAIASIEAVTDTFSVGGEVHTTTRLKMKMHDKTAALDKLMKHLGMYIKKIEVTGANGGPVEIANPENTRRKLAEKLAGLGDRLQQGRNITLMLEKGEDAA